MINIKNLTVLLLTYVLVCVSAGSSYTQTQDTTQPKNVLVLFSLEPANPAFEIIFESLKKTIRSSYKRPVNFYLDFLENSRFSDEEHVTNFVNYISEKYEGRKFELLISVGPGMYPIIHKFKSPIFDGLPKLFNEMVSPYSNNNYNIEEKNSMAVLYDLGIEENIKRALDLKPDTKNIYVITGASGFDIWINALYKSAFNQYENRYVISFLQGPTLKSLMNLLGNLPEKSIVFMPTYQRDSLATSYYGKEVLENVSRYSNSPIFTLFSSAVTAGVIGGYLVNMENLGRGIGETAVSMLSGEIPDSTVTYYRNFSNYMFDWNQLKKWGIDEKRLPEGSIILNREYTFLELYYVYMIAGVIFVITETLLLTYLIALFRRQKYQAIKIKEQEDRYKTLVDFNRLTELSELTASLSHELNQPLTAILSSSQASLRFLKNDRFDKPLFEEIMTNIVEDVKRASGIMISLRKMIKKETREKKRININKIAQDVFVLFSSQAAIRDVIVEAEYDEINPLLFADPILIQQVILNLLLNALEVTGKTSVRAKKILLKTEVCDGYVNISVKDNGPGVPDTIKQDIFKPFFSTKKNGLGIGLAICRSIIENHHGTIQFTNNETSGATFTFNLKLNDEGI